MKAFVSLQALQCIGSAGLQPESTQFATESQPTLNALWRRPPDQQEQPLAKRVKREPPPQAAECTKKVLPSWDSPGRALANGWIKEPSVSPPLGRDGGVFIAQPLLGGRKMECLSIWCSGLIDIAVFVQRFTHIPDWAFWLCACKEAVPNQPVACVLSAVGIQLDLCACRN